MSQLRSRERLNSTTAVAAAGQDVVDSGAARREEPCPPADLERLVADDADFAVALYRQLAGGDFAGRDLFLSPHSISVALAMTWAGAGAETADEMDRAVHLGLPPDRLHHARNTLDRSLQPAGEGPTGGDPFRLSIVSVEPEPEPEPEPELFCTTAKNIRGGDSTMRTLTFTACLARS